MGHLLTPDVARFIIATIIVVMVIGCLSVIGSEFHKAVLWHDLKVKVQNLRSEQKRRLDQITEDSGGGSKRGTLPSIAGTVGPPAAEAVEVPEAA